MTATDPPSETGCRAKVRPDPPMRTLVETPAMIPGSPEAPTYSPARAPAGVPVVGANTAHSKYGTRRGADDVEHMLSPLPRRSGWAYSSLCFTQPYQPSPKGLSGRPVHRPFRGLLGVHSRCGLHTRAVTVFRDTLSEGFSYFVTSIAAPVASGWSVRRVGFAPTGKRRLVTAHG